MFFRNAVLLGLFGRSAVSDSPFFKYLRPGFRAYGTETALLAIAGKGQDK
jgi:hypothetical protein